MLRLIIAVIVAPSLPIGLLAFTYASQTGSDAWYAILFLCGYLFFIFVGPPILGVLIHSRKLSTCAVSGGAVTVAPIFLLGIFSILSNNQVFTPEMLLNLLLLFFAGCLGGMVFWLIAFAQVKKMRHPR